MLSLPQPSKFLIVDLPGAATSSSSAEDLRGGRHHLSATSKAEKEMILHQS